MSVRRPYVAANWKMNKTVAESATFLDRFLPEIDGLGEVDVVICPPYTSLSVAVERCRRTPVRIAAQNMHEAESGAYTGEVSTSMLLDVGVSVVVLGHSERRQLFGESDDALARKLPAALGAGLEPILCVGETEAERDAGETEAVLRRQLEADLATLEGEALRRLVIAYEPVWAIGTGRTATPQQAQDAIAFVRSIVTARDAEAADGMQILYGGSVKPDNAAELMSQPDIDGALVGGASLDPGEFLTICRAAGR